MRVYQEFFCASSGGGCGGYITVRLNMSLNGVIEVVCPKCGHKHQRILKDGVLGDHGRYRSNPTEQLCPTLAAWSKKPKYSESGKRAGGQREREAVVIEERDPSRQFLHDRKFELWGAPK